MSNATQPTHPLRQRMIEDMSLRGISPGTQKHYVRAVRACCTHLGTKPSDLTGELARSYLLHLQGTGVGYGTVNGHSTALRFFLRVTLGRRDEVERVPVLRRPKSLPAILTPEEVARIIAAAPGLKYRTALSVTYGAGLRASETASLKVSGIDSRAMTLRIEQGSRHVQLPR
jgi:site-specific recombinase XerD